MGRYGLGAGLMIQQVDWAGGRSVWVDWAGGRALALKAGMGRYGSVWVGMDLGKVKRVGKSKRAAGQLSQTHPSRLQTQPPWGGSTAHTLKGPQAGKDATSLQSRCHFKLQAAVIPARTSRLPLNLSHTQTTPNTGPAVPHSHTRGSEVRSPAIFRVQAYPPRAGIPPPPMTQRTPPTEN